MSELGSTALLSLAGYTVGAIPFGVLVGILCGVNVRASGSGNIGATNVARTLGKRLGLFVLVLDAAKGALVPALVLYGSWFEMPSSAAFIAIGLAPVIGHCFSPWLRFRGGKGVATTLGVLLAIDPVLAAGAAAIFALTYAAFAVVSIASLTAAALLPLGFWLRSRGVEPCVMGALLAAIIFIQHRGNIMRILRRSELRL